MDCGGPCTMCEGMRIQILLHRYLEKLNYHMIINPTKMLWLFILAFYQRKSGEVCNHENSVITTEKECTKALLKLGYEVKKGYWYGSTKNIPSGCSIRLRNNRPHLNDYSGVGNGRKGQIPICKGTAD